MLQLVLVQKSHQWLRADSGARTVELTAVTAPSGAVTAVTADVGQVCLLGFWCDMMCKVRGELFFEMLRLFVSSQHHQRACLGPFDKAYNRFLQLAALPAEQGSAWWSVMPAHCSWLLCLTPSAFILKCSCLSHQLLFWLPRQG
jgi:hypothetical protein